MAYQRLKRRKHAMYRRRRRNVENQLNEKRSEKLAMALKQCISISNGVSIIMVSAAVSTGYR